jgi:hypothetical protein
MSMAVSTVLMGIQVTDSGVDAQSFAPLPPPAPAFLLYNLNPLLAVEEGRIL